MNSTKKRGLFLTVEGVEGCGKTTNLQFIEEYLKAANVPVVCTREPGGTPLAEELRDLLLANREEVVNPQAELLMIFAARAQHFHQVVLPALNRGEWVLCDRFTDATFAYQGGGRGLPIDMIAQLEHLVQAGVQPDKTIFLDLEVQQGLARATQRGALDRFECEDSTFFDSVRAAYWQRINESPERFALVDASVILPDVQQQIRNHLDALMANLK